jgi:adenylate cyclase
MSPKPGSTLANPEQLIADLQRQLAEREAELAECRAERDEVREQQTATAEVLQVINSSPGDLTPVFDAILEKAHSLCSVEYGCLLLYDGERFRSVATRGYPEKLAEFLRHPFSLEPSSPVRALLHGAPLVEIPDVIAHQAEAPNPRAEATIAVGIRRVLFLPLRRDNLLGVISAGRKEAKPFQAKEIALLQNFAAQAVIAMENARLITETREALEQQTATAEVLGVINSSPGDLAPVFDAILEKAHTLCGAAHGVMVIREGEGVGTVAANGEPAFVEAMRQLGPMRPPDGSGAARLIRGEQIVHIADFQAESFLENAPPQLRRVSELGRLRTVVMVPLLKDDAVIGFITAFRQEVRPFSDKQIALLQNFAAQAVVAIENARLIGELRERTDQVAELNRGLEARVAEQVEELGRVGRLKRFLAPQLAELIVSQGDEKILESHRRDIVVVFCDLRGYTAFTETAEPEDVLEFLREYHGALGPLVALYEGTLDQFSGDGIMVFFNDPVPCPDPAERAVRMTMAMREAARKLIADWSRHGCELGFGAGIAQGYATLGQIGFSERSGYTAIGTVCNLAARLCAEAKDGQILVSSRIAGAVEAVVNLEDLGNLELRGLRRPVAAFNVVQSASAADARPNLTVVARAPGARS